MVGGNSSAGNLEIFLNGQWNRICSYLFHQTAADVACRQLGYSGAIGFYDDGRYVCVRVCTCVCMCVCVCVCVLVCVCVSSRI